ncbi:MAG TPA: hypothetical protein VI749_08655 [Candidatus Omnitrophota bacterium]|nr:hypothetical protein [Candidatus Omnitrophota bacterium]
MRQDDMFFESFSKQMKTLAYLIVFSYVALGVSLMWTDLVQAFHF